MAKSENMDNQQAQRLFEQGMSYEKQGEWSEALRCYTRLRQQAPLAPRLLIKLTRVYRQLEQFDKAWSCIDTARQQSLSQQLNTLIHYEEGQLAQLVDDHVRAIKAFSKLTEYLPDFSEGYRLLGVSYQELYQHNDAVISFERALSLGVSDSIAVKCSLASSLSQSHEEIRAIELYQQVLKEAPDCYQACYGLAMVLHVQGEFDLAAECYRLCNKHKPDFAEAYQQLCSTRKFKTDEDKDILILEQVLAQEKNSYNQARLHFGLGKAYDDCQSYDKAMEHFIQANRLKKMADNSYSHSQWEDYISSIIEAFPAEIFESSNSSGSESEMPYWIIGMPRSGTTLCEQILSSHSQVAGAGELTYFAQEVKQALETFPSTEKFLDPNKMLSLQRGYIELLKKLGKKTQHVIDKYPSNYLFVGLAKLMFPKMKIIYTSRSPIDTCLSMFFQDFVSGNTYSHDLDDLAHYYLQHQKLMSHWNNVLPGEIYDFNYESLLKNQLEQTQKLLNYCHLEWDQSCLDFSENKRIVTTHSAWQVRQPIYTSSSNRWEPYQKYLEVLINAFSD